MRQPGPGGGDYLHAYEWQSEGFGPFTAAIYSLEELARWFAAGVVLGCCYAYLPGRIGLVKSMALLVAPWLAVIVLELIHVARLPDSLAFDPGLFTVILVVVAVFMDWQTLHARRVDQRHLGDVYKLHVVKSGAVLAPLDLGLLTIIHEIAIGKWDAVKNLVQDLAK